jgi:hypothetical protein
MSRYWRPRVSKWDDEPKQRPYERHRRNRRFRLRKRTPFKESRRGRARSRSMNPFNATRPAEWATMSKSHRKAWNRRHWRSEQWKADLALKKEATRLRHRHERADRWNDRVSGGIESVVGLIRGNPRWRRNSMIRTNRYRSGRSKRARSNPLRPGHSRAIVSANIREMIRHGHPQRQAVAAALSNARRHPRSSSHRPQRRHRR